MPRHFLSPRLVLAMLLAVQLLASQALGAGVVNGYGSADCSGSVELLIPFQVGTCQSVNTGAFMKVRFIGGRNSMATTLLLGWAWAEFAHALLCFN